MSDKKKSFVMYQSWGALFAGLSVENAGHLIKGIYAMQEGEEVAFDDPTINAIFTMIANTLSEDGKKYKEKCDKNREIANERERKKEKETKHNERERTCTNVNERTRTYYDNESDYDSDNDSDNDIKEPPKPPKGVPTTSKQPKPSKPKKDITKDNADLFDRLIPSYAFPEALKAKARDWILYKGQRKEPYTEIGLKSLLKQMQDKANEYGPAAIIDLIGECMGNCWKGIIWDKLKGNPARASGSAYLDRIDNRYDVVDRWLQKGETNGNDNATVFNTGEGDEIHIPRPKIHS